MIWLKISIWVHLHSLFTHINSKLRSILTNFCRLTDDIKSVLNGKRMCDGKKKDTKLEWMSPLGNVPVPKGSYPLFLSLSLSSSPSYFSLSPSLSEFFVSFFRFSRFHYSFLFFFTLSSLLKIQTPKVFGSEYFPGFVLWLDDSFSLPLSSSLSLFLPLSLPHQKWK